MITRFDHAVLAVNSLPHAVTRMAEQFGFDVYAGGRHTGLGTENAVIRFELDYIEMLGIVDRDEILAAGIKRAPLLDYLAGRSGGWLAFCMATDDIDALAARFQEVGLESLGPYTMARARPDGEILRWRLLVPEGTAWRRPWPFFIQWDLPDAERLALEKPGDHKMGKGRVWGVRVIVRDLSAAEYLYAEQLGFQHEGRETCTMPGTEVSRFEVGDFHIELISPTAPGPTMDSLEADGEGLWEVILEAENLTDALNAFSPYASAVAQTKYSITVDLTPAEDSASQARLSVL